MAITYKVFLDERRKRADNIYPLKIRITVDRRHKEVSLGVTLSKKHWDSTRQKVKPSHPNFKLIQLKITKYLTSLQEKALLIEKQDRIVSHSNLLSSPIRKEDALNFLSFGREQVDLLLKSGRVGNSVAYSCALNKLQKFVGDTKIRFQEINYRFLDAFSTSMLNEGLKPNAIACYMREIRAIYNKAIKMEVVEAKYYPFLKYKIKTEKTINRTLTLDELKAIASLDLSTHPNRKVYHSLFLLSFYLIGINFADLLTLKPESVINGRIIFHRKKTGKIYSVKVHERTSDLFRSLANERKNRGEYLLPFVNSNDTPLKQRKDISLLIHATNENLKGFASSLGILKPVSTYYARYTWANVAKSLGYSKDLIAEALGHEYGNRVTGIYLDHYDKDVIDAMNENILAKIFDSEWANLGFP